MQQFYLHSMKRQSDIQITLELDCVSLSQTFKLKSTDNENINQQLLLADMTQRTLRTTDKSQKLCSMKYVHLMKL